MKDDYTISHIWIAEAEYSPDAWYMLWTTCRLTRDECRIALANHPTRKEHTGSRIIKFVRTERRKS